MGKKKGKKNENVPEASGTAPQKTPVEGPPRGAPPSQPGSSQKSFSSSGKASDGSQEGSGGSGGCRSPPSQRSAQGGSAAQSQKGASGQHPGKSPSHSGRAADGFQVGHGPQKPPQGGSGGPPAQKQPQGYEGPSPQRPPQGAGGPPSKKHPQGSGGPPSQKQSQVSGGPPSQRQPQSPAGPLSQRQPQGSAGPAFQDQPQGSRGSPSQKQPQGSGGPPPHGIPAQPQKSAWGQQSVQQVAPAGQPYKGPQSGPAGQPPKDSQGAAKAPKKGPQKGLSQGPSAQQPLGANPATHSGADDSQKKASSQPLKSQSGKENVPPKQKDQKAVPQKVEGKRGEKFPQPDQPLMEIPRRKAEGTLGRKIKLQVNLLPLNFDNLCAEIIHYDVAFDPERPKRLLRPALDLFVEQNFPLFYVAFDGRKNLYSAKRLPFGNRIEGAVIVKNPERSSNNEIEFKIQVQFAQSIDTNLIRRFFNQRTNRAELLDTPQTAIQAIDVVLRTALSRTALVPVGRSYFLPPIRDPFNLGGGLDLWHGFYQSAILNWKPFLNVDVAHKGFPKPIPLTDLLKDVCGLPSLNQQLREDQIRKFRGFITTLKVAYEVRTQLNSRRIYRVNGLGRSAREHTFESNGIQMSVKDYYRREKRYELRYPDLPTVQVDPAQKGIYLPLELCTLLEGQAVNRKLDQFQTREMIREAAKPPLDRKERIMNAIRAAKYNESKVVGAFGINVSDNFAEVPARVLPPPSILYKNDRALDPSGGQWGTGMFLSSRELKKWVILNLDFRTQPSTLNRFSAELINQARRQGMTIREVMDVRNLDTRQLQPGLRNLMTDWKEKEVELVLVVLPMTSDTYGKVKQTAELQVGILTQCVRCQTLKNERNFSSSCENLVKKINAKTNGINHQLGGGANRPWPRVLHAALAEPIMFVGMDVTHPSPDQKDIPSVAAVSASHDREALFQYNMIWRLQPPRMEIIQDLKNIIKEHLFVFYTKTRYKPRKIIVYRDGVSEGQFRQVLTYELLAIRQACTELQSDYKPGITFLVVQKRHHVRFFPTNPKEADRKGNVLPGTIVDTEITHPRELDFYLASHASLQGTSRPTKYHRLWDDNDISEDDLEVLTYYLCHLFSRCNRSVSYPAPTYYAHLAAYRARVYLENNHLNLNEPDALQKFHQRNQIRPDFRSASPMFFV